jgi:fructuronate reductase
VNGLKLVPPVRIVHLGLGAFGRAHQAWYTAHASDSDGWGIAAFTGRSPRAAEELRKQDCLYTLIERGSDGDRAEIMTPIVEAHDGSDLHRLRELLSSPRVALVTMTVTETAYLLRADGLPDVDDPAVAADILALRERRDPRTVLGRLLSGLEARRRADGPGIAIVPCDNVPGNGPMLRSGLIGLADLVDPALAAWLQDTVSFVSTSVDRITPRTTDADRRAAEELTGFQDASPVVAEPFSDWVLSGKFPSGRPDWEGVGARFVDNVEPFERRKLWLLNGAHSLLAYAGLTKGFRTVAEAMSDDECRSWVHDLWDEDIRHLPDTLDLDAYRTTLEDRFDNARIAHNLKQIAMEGSTKLSVRIAPVLRAERAAGRSGAASIRALAAWVVLQQTGFDLYDANESALAQARRSARPVQALLSVVDAELATDSDVVSALTAATVS